MSCYVTLEIPADRLETKKWIESQPAVVVADIFDVAKQLFQFTSSIASVQQNDKIALIIQGHMKVVRERENKIASLNEELEILKHKLDEMSNSKCEEARVYAQKQILLSEEMHRNQMKEMMKTQNEMIIKTQEQMKISYESTSRRYEDEINRLSSEIQVLRNSDQTSNSHMSDVLRESTSVLKQFTKDVSSGFTGEDLVRSVFNEEINTGYLEDTSRSVEPGAEDYLWKKDGVVISVEVKFKGSIHSIHDMQKHRERIYEAARMNKINIAIFLSLKCRIPNKPLISVENVSGIPVIYAALGAGLSPKQVIQNAFVFASALARSTSEKEQNQTDSELLVDQVVSSFDKFMKNLNQQQDLIHQMRRQVNQNFRCLEALEKNKNQMISEIEGVRTDHPYLCPVLETHDSDNSDIIQTILEYLAKHRKSPTSPDQLPGFDTSQDELNTLIKTAKREKKRRMN